MHGEDLARHSILGVCGFELKPCHNDGPAAAFRPLLNKCSAGVRSIATDLFASRLVSDGRRRPGAVALVKVDQTLGRRALRSPDR